MASSSLSGLLSPSTRLQFNRSSLLLRRRSFIASISQLISPLRASRRFPNYPQDAVVVIPGARPWIRGEERDGVQVRGGGDGDDEDDDDDDDEEDDEDRSLDLLVRFLHNMFRKISRRARKSVRSVLPTSISTKLVGFSVNGVLVLAFLWIFKAFLEVVCTFGSMVFVTILLVRGIWSGVSYMKENRYHYSNRVDDDDNNPWSRVQPAS